MNLRILRNTILFFFTCSTILFSQNCSIIVEVRGIKELKGQLMIGLFDSPVGFPEKTKKSIGKTIKVIDSTIAYKFKNLNKGEYAIAVYHDENSNGKLDKNFLGIPTEDYVFSNYASGSFGPPGFDDAKFTLVDSLKITLDLQK